jgi:hypothetical protein
MTDDEISIPDAIEWVDEPPGETKLYLGRNQLDDEDYQTTAREVTRAVLDANPREAVAINALGLTDLLRNIDGDAVDVLSNESGLTVNEMELYGKTEATPEILDALLALYSNALLTLTVYGADGTAIIARRDGTMLWCWLPESAYPKLGQRLDETMLAALEQS